MTSPASPSSRPPPPPGGGRLPHGGRFGGLFQCCDIAVVLVYASLLYWILLLGRGMDGWICSSTINNEPRQARHKLLAYPPNDQNERNGMFSGSWKKIGTKCNNPKARLLPLRKYLGVEPRSLCNLWAGNGWTNRLCCRCLGRYLGGAAVYLPFVVGCAALDVLEKKRVRK